MSFRTSPEVALLGSVVGNGQCVAYVQRVATCPLTVHWRKGELVKGAVLTPGTAIATFDEDGRYGNHEDGRSHAAIYLSQDAQGLNVIDQWVGQPVHQRKIWFDDSRKDVNNGNRFCVIESV